MSGLYEVTEESMIAARQAGVAYWERNRNINLTEESIASLARSRHWHDGDCEAFVAGFFEAKRRDEEKTRLFAEAAAKQVKGDCSKWFPDTPPKATLQFSSHDITLLRCGLLRRMDNLKGRPECEVSYTRSIELMQILWDARKELDKQGD